MGCDILLYSIVVPGILLKPAWDFVYRAKLTSKHIPGYNGNGAIIRPSPGSKAVASARYGCDIKLGLV